MHSVHLPFQCSKVYRLHDQQNQDNSFNFRFQIGNDQQSKRLLANLGRILEVTPEKGVNNNVIVASVCIKPLFISINIYQYV
jgi:hypothetical protein